MPGIMHAIVVLICDFINTGTMTFVHEHPELLGDDEVIQPISQCRKDTGDHRRMRHWSRGHLFIVRTCGHIETWRPLFK